MSLMKDKPAAQWVPPLEINLSPDGGPKPSEWSWQITAPCLRWPSCVQMPQKEFGDPVWIVENWPKSQWPSECGNGLTVSPCIPHVDSQPMPVPGTLALMGALLIAVGWAHRRWVQ